MLMRRVRRPLAREVYHFTDEEIGLRAVGAIKERANQTGGALVHLTCAALLVCTQAVLRTHEAGSKAALVFGACHCDFCVCAASDGNSGVLRNMQQNSAPMEAVLARYGLGLAFPSEGNRAAHQIINNFLCVVKVHDVARRHLDNAELHAHHFRIVYCGNHLIIALVKRGLCCVFHVDRSFVGMRFIKIKNIVKYRLICQFRCTFLLQRGPRRAAKAVRKGIYMRRMHECTELRMSC